MPIERSYDGIKWSLIAEGVILLICAPFLLFPNTFWWGTVFALIFIIILWLMPLLSKNWGFSLPTPFDFLLIIFGLAFIVSILVSADPEFTLPKATGVILGFAVWRFMHKSFPSKRTFFAWLVLYILLGASFVFLGVISVNWLDKVPAVGVIIAKLPTGLLVIPEAPAAGVHSNQLAGTLLLYIPFFISIVLGFYWSRPSMKRLFLILILTIGLLGMLLLTQSRSGWLAFAASMWILLLFWWLALPKSEAVRKVILGFLGVLAIGVSLLLASLGTSRLTSIWEDPNQQSFVGNLSTINFRQEVWRWALAAIQDFPFTGTGLGSFRVVVRRLYPLNVEPTYDIAHAHNVFLQMALDLGLPGLIVYIGLISLVCYLGVWAARRNDEQRPFILGILGGLAALHLFGLTDALALGSKPHLIFWIMMGLISLAYQQTWLDWQENEAMLSLKQADL